MQKQDIPTFNAYKNAHNQLIIIKNKDPFVERPSMRKGTMYVIKKNK